MVEVVVNLTINLIITILFVIRKIKEWFIDSNIKCTKPNCLEKCSIPSRVQQLSQSFVIVKIMIMMMMVQMHKNVNTIKSNCQIKINNVEPRLIACNVPIY